MGEFQADPMRVAAVERHLQKISEAAIRLGWVERSRPSWGKST